MSDDDFLAENEKDGQGSDDCFLENWAALRTRLEGGRLELLAAGCVLPPHLWPAAPPYAPPLPLRVLPPHLWPAAPPYAPPRPKRFILQLAAVLVDLIHVDSVVTESNPRGDVLQYLAVLARLTIQQEIADLIHVDSVVTESNPRGDGAKSPWFTLIVDAGLCTGAACHERVQMLKACMEGRSGVPSVLPRGVKVDLEFLLSVLFPVLYNLFQSVVTEKIKECGFYVMDIDDKRLGAEVMYLRFLAPGYRRARLYPGYRRARQRRVPGYMRGRSRFCEHCRKSFRVGSLATTCPIDRCGNLHWTCLRPHAEQCHPLKCV